MTTIIRAGEATKNATSLSVRCERVEHAGVRERRAAPDDDEDRDEADQEVHERSRSRVDVGAASVSAGPVARRG